MQKVIHLKNPILIDNKTVSEISYDSNEITALLYTEAEAKRKAAVGVAAASLTVELDFGLHMYLGFAAAIAANPNYSFEDLERVKGADVLAFSKVGRNFLMGSEESQPSKSEDVSETTAAPTTQALQTLNEKE